jgi:hypothetical protein
MPVSISWPLTGQPGVSGTPGTFVPPTNPVPITWPLLLPPFMVPTTGIMTGGDSFTISAQPLNNSIYVDKFPGVTLNPALWQNISTGTGTVSVNNGLTLNIGQSGAGFAGIRTQIQYNNFDVVVPFASTQKIEASIPAAPIIFFQLRAFFGVNDNVSLIRQWDPTLGAVVKMTYTTSGTTYVLSILPASSSLQTFRIIRVNGRLIGYAGAAKMGEVNGWYTAPLNIDIFSSSTGVLPQSFSTSCASYVPNILVTFGLEPSISVAQLPDGTIIGSVPAYAVPEPVTVTTWTIASSQNVSTLFTYFAPLQLTLTGDSPLQIIINNDNTLQDTSPTLPGLRL